MSENDSPPIYGAIAKFGVIPVASIDDIAWTLPLADALAKGGLPILEITFRTNAAADAIALLRRERPEMIVGAGTILSEGNAVAAVRAGAQFGVSPGCTPNVVLAARDAKLPFIPGVANPSDIEHALACGMKVMKFFPAEALGGIPMMKAIGAPFSHLGIRYIPTGGIGEANLAGYLTLKSVMAVGGTWLTRKEDLVNGRWADIATRSRRTAQLAKQTIASIQNG